VKVMIVDDHPIVVSGFKALLEGQHDIEVVAAADAAQGEALFLRAAPDVALVDINLPGSSGFALAQRLIGRDPTARIILFSMNDDPVFVAQAMEIGARGFVSKNDDPAAILIAIRVVVDGGDAWPSGLTDQLAYLSDRGRGARGLMVSPSISPRDHQVLRLLATGQSLSEIAEIVGVSYKTVATTCVNLRAKLGARTQSELVAIAVERRIV
jgi:two-component system, NarL family, invasion response regulator UvrY